MEKCREEFENWFLSTPTGKALSAANLDYYIFERQFDEYRDRDVEMAHRGYAYQQAKVEGLQNHAQEIHKREIKLFEKTLILTHERDELQKRVDMALELCKKGGALSACLAMRVEQALKGEG